MANILFRYGFREKLNFLLGRPGDNGLDISKLKNESIGNDIPWHNEFAQNHDYNIFALHGSWQLEDFE